MPALFEIHENARLSQYASMRSEALAVNLAANFPHWAKRARTGRYFAIVEMAIEEK
jgi:hypothetical protein